jgi:hypothetical protein
MVAVIGPRMGRQWAKEEGVVVGSGSIAGNVRTRPTDRAGLAFATRDPRRGPARGRAVIMVP